MNTKKINFKQTVLTTLLVVSTIFSAISISTIAQENKLPTPSLDQGIVCQRVKDNLKTRFDVNKEKQEAVPFKLQAFLDKKLDQAKSQDNSSPRLDNITNTLGDKIKEAQASYIKLFNLFEKIKTSDCTDAKDFSDLIRQASEILQEIRMQQMMLIVDTRRQLPLLTRMTRNNPNTGGSPNRNNPETEAQNLSPNGVQPSKNGNPNRPTKLDNLSENQNRGN